MLKRIASLPLHWQIMLALVLAVIAGSLSGETASLFGVNLYSVYEFFGTLFLNALKMLIVPLVVSSIIVGMMGIGSGENLGRLGGKTLVYYAVS
ncbi:MAG TPA: cation:dicarboxylase symporter family transporter, partial [Gammaproteobacteria bacterium]